jgi:hypothetical protein
MWNPFSRKPADAMFPKPQWAPIQALQSIDIMGKRRDGGVDLIITASQPLDDTAEVLESIRRKVGTYLAVIDLDEFQTEMGHPPRDKTTIIISCEHPIHPTAQAVIAECQITAARRGVRLEVRKRV